MANTLASVVIQDLTYTARRHGQSILVSYINGGVAGAESVTVTDNHIRVTIASGTSTATQIKAAVDLDGDSKALVSVAITGTGSNTQKTCVSASLSGGHAAAAASLLVDSTMLLTADSTGTAGNSIRFRFTAGGTAGSEVVSVASSDISVQIADGVSTFAQIKTAIEASGPAAALVNITFVGPTTLRKAKVASMSSYVNLAGGLAAAAPAVVVQDITIAADATGTAANGKTFSYTTGAVAGSEVVSVTSGNISVQISNGVSTATQITTALNAAAPFTSVYNVTMSGVGGTAQKTVNSAPLAGEAVPSLKDYFANQASIPLTTSYVAQPFGFHARTITLINDETNGGDTITYSFNGSTAAGVLNPGESMMSDILENGQAVISLKGSGAADYRLEVMGI